MLNNTSFNFLPLVQITNSQVKTDKSSSSIFNVVGNLTGKGPTELYSQKQKYSAIEINWNKLYNVNKITMTYK